METTAKKRAARPVAVGLHPATPTEPPHLGVPPHESRARCRSRLNARPLFHQTHGLFSTKLPSNALARDPWCILFVGLQVVSLDSIRRRALCLPLLGLVELAGPVFIW